MTSWDTDATLGWWCVTWDIHNPWDDELTRLKRSVIATWQPVEMWQGQLELLRAKRYQNKVLGTIYL